MLERRMIAHKYMIAIVWVFMHVWWLAASKNMSTVSHKHGSFYLKKQKEFQIKCFKFIMSHVRHKIRQKAVKVHFQLTFEAPKLLQMCQM